MTTQTDFFSDTRRRNKQLALAGSATVGALGATVAFSQPANASVAEVEAAVTAIGGVAAAAATIVVLAMGTRLAIKQVNRVATKA